MARTRTRTISARGLVQSIAGPETAEVVYVFSRRQFIERPSSNPFADAGAQSQTPGSPGGPPLFVPSQITGTPVSAPASQEGVLITASIGTVASPLGLTALTYQHLIDGVVVASGLTYTPALADVGLAHTVTVSGTETGAGPFGPISSAPQVVGSAAGGG